MNFPRGWNKFSGDRRNQLLMTLPMYLSSLSEISRLEDVHRMGWLPTFGWILLGLWCAEVILFLLSYRQSRSS